MMFIARDPPRWLITRPNEVRIKVNNVGASAGGSSRKDEVRMVQDIDCRSLDFKPDPFCDPNSLGETHIQVEVTRTAKSVYREIAECARGWRRHQTWLKYRGGSLAG